MRILPKVLLALTLIGTVTTLPAKGAKAPEFSLPGRNATVSLSSYRGRLVYVDFWASWCVPCRKSFPWMNAMHQKYEKYGLSIVAINLDEDRALADRFLERVPAEFVIAFDPSAKTAESYGVKVMPSSFIVNRQGDLVAVHKGFRSKDTAKMEKQIRQLLAN